MNLSINIIQQAGSGIASMMRANSDAVWRAAVQATKRVASDLQAQLRNDIAGAGKFKGAWISGLTAVVVDAKPNLSITISHSIAFASIFDTGGTIKGKPLLWIPLSYTGLTVKASQFGGGLFRVNRQGKPPLLLSLSDRLPKYVGVESVTLKKLFHFSNVIDRSMSGFADMFQSFLKV